MSLLKKFMLEGSDPVAVANTLLRVEPLGVLDRDICYQSIPLDGERTEKVIIPPRLFFLPKQLLLVHAYGDDAFYDLFPEFERGGLSKECYVLQEAPHYLSNYFAMQDLYEQGGIVPKEEDRISLTYLRPKPMSATEQREWIRQRRKEIKERDKRLLGLTLVK